MVVLVAIVECLSGSLTFAPRLFASTGWTRGPSSDFAVILTVVVVVVLFMSPCVVAGVVLSCVCVLLGGGRRSWCGCVKNEQGSTLVTKAACASDHVDAPHVRGTGWRSRVITPFG